jgi:hypothetical protein
VLTQFQAAFSTSTLDAAEPVRGLISDDVDSSQAILTASSFQVAMKIRTNDQEREFITEEYKTYYRL